jgi:hypothetical protein
MTVDKSQPLTPPEEDERTRGLSPAGRRLRLYLLEIYTLPLSELEKRDMEEHPETWVD